MNANDPNFEQTGSDGPPSETEQLREEIAETREELGGTVEALAHKTDVKAQAGEKVAEKREDARAKVTEMTEEARAKLAEAQSKATQAPPVQKAKEQPWIPAVAAAALGLLLIGILRRRRS